MVVRQIEVAAKKLGEYPGVKLSWVYIQVVLLGVKALSEGWPLSEAVRALEQTFALGVALEVRLFLSLVRCPGGFLVLLLRALPQAEAEGGPDFWDYPLH